MFKDSLWLLLILVALFAIGARICYWVSLQLLIAKISKLTNTAKELLPKQGDEDARFLEGDVREKLSETEMAAGDTYKEAIKLTAPLLGWKVLGRLCSKRIRMAVARSGFVEVEQRAAYSIFWELMLGSECVDTPNYYPVRRLIALLNALREVKLFFLF